MTDPRPTVAIVIPVFNEESGAASNSFSRLDAALRGARGECAWRAVFVNDLGSRDRSAGLIREHGAGATRRFELVELSRNFGFQSALSAGLGRTPGTRTPS